MPNGSIGMREMKAEGGWGVISMQLAEIDPTSDISNLPMEKLWDGTDVKSHALMVERVKKHGAITAVEIAHTGLRARNMDTGARSWPVVSAYSETAKPDPVESNGQGRHSRVPQQSQARGAAGNASRL